MNETDQRTTDLKPGAPRRRPSLFVIGDSISCYYGGHLREMLAGWCDYDRKGGRHRLEDVQDGTNGENGGDSRMVLTYFKAVVERDFFHPDFLLLNCGLHDTKPDGEGFQVPLDAYIENLRTILAIARERGIRVIWARTTPVNETSSNWLPGEMERRKGAVDRYNAAADRIMAEHRIPVIDLHAFTRSLGPAIYLNGNDVVHFDDTTARLQAAFIAGALGQIVVQGCAYLRIISVPGGGTKPQ